MRQEPELQDYITPSDEKQPVIHKQNETKEKKMICQSCHKEESMKYTDICAICFGALQGCIQDMLPRNEWPDCLLRYTES